MASLKRSGIALLGILVLTCVAQGQMMPIPNPAPEHIIINFIVQVDPNTVNALLNIVNAYVRNGTKKVTIVLASSGGDPASGFAGYNILRAIPAEITTFNAGNIDSATLLLYCAGKNRYSLPSPARFLIHSTALNPIQTNFPVDMNFLESQLAQVKSMNQVFVQVLKANSKKDLADIENAVHGQTILSPEEAKQWGLVQEIRTSFIEPGAVFVSVNNPELPKETPSRVGEKPTITSGGNATQ